MIKFFAFSAALFLFAGSFCQSLINLLAAEEEHCAFRLPADVKGVSENPGQKVVPVQESENDSFPRDISVIIPDNVQIINNGFEKTRASEKNYWLCNSAKIAHTGANNRIFLETGAELKLKGTGNRVYLKKGAVFSLKGGNDNEIYYETGANIILEGRRNKNEYVEVNSLEYKFGKVNPCQKITEIKEKVDLIPGEYIATDTEMAINSEPDLQVQLSESLKDIKGVLRAIDSNKEYYIHARAKYTHSGNDNRFFVEKGGKLKIISGKNNTVYLEKGAQVHFYFPFKNTVIYAKGAVISFENEAGKQQVALEEHDQLSFKF